MGGMDAETWWRYRSRIEAGELWVAPGARGRRLQRLVLVSSSVVLELVARQDEDLGSLVSACCSAAAELRTATVGLVTTLGVERVAGVLGLAPAVIRSLGSPDAPVVVLKGVLRRDRNRAAEPEYVPLRRRS